MRYLGAEKWICDDCQISRGPNVRVKQNLLSGMAIALAVIAALFGDFRFGNIGVLGGSAVIIALVALYRGGRRAAWIALLVSVACLATTLFLRLA